MIQVNAKSLSGTTVLVTGGAGFIGSHLVRRLLNDGHQVRVIDNLVTGKRENLEPVLDHITWIQGSITDPEAVAEAVAGTDTIFHQCALPSVPRSVRDPLASNNINVNGTLNILVAARDAGVRRVIYAASSSAYGNSASLPKEESMPSNPLSPYAVAKLAAEQYCGAFYRVYGLETVALRYFNVFGPRQDPNSEYAAVIPRFITALMDDREITIFGDGEQSRDFTFIENTLDGNIRAMTAPDAPGQMCNVACGDRFTLNHLAETLGEILNVTPRIKYQEPRQGDVKHSLASIEKARQILGYEPKVNFYEGLQRTVAYFQALRSDPNSVH